MNPACSISHAALDFTDPLSSGQAGAPSGTASTATTGFVKKDPALQVSWSASSSTIPLPARRPRTAERTSSRGPAASANAQRAGELGVLHRGAEAALAELEGHQHDVPTGVGLEPAVPVAEAAVGVGEGPDARSSRSQTRTEAMVWATSWP